MALMWWYSSQSCTTLSSMSIKNRVDIEIIKGNQSSRFCRRKTDLIFQDTQKDTHHKSSVEHLGHQELPTHQQQHHNCATSSMLGDGMSQSSTPEQVLLKIPASLQLSPCQQVSSMHLASAYANRAYKSGTTSWTKRIMGVLKIRYDMYQIYSHDESIGLCQKRKPCYGQHVQIIFVLTIPLAQDWLNLTKAWDSFHKSLIWSSDRYREARNSQSGMHSNSSQDFQDN